MSIQQQQQQQADDPLWFEDPNVLVRSTDLFPVYRQTEVQRVNAATRLLLVITLALFALTRNISTLIIGFACALGLAALFCMSDAASATSSPRLTAVFFALPAATGVKQQQQQQQQQEQEDAAAKKPARRRPPAEGFVAPANYEKKESGNDAATTEFLNSVQSAVQNDTGVYQRPSPLNPFGNLLEPDALLRPKRRQAPPLTSPEAREDVYTAMKNQVKMLHPDIAERLFLNKAEELRFRQSLRPFFTNTSTALIADTTGAWMSMVPNTAAWRDGECRHGSIRRPRAKVGAKPGVAVQTGAQSNFTNTADILSAP